MIIEIKIKIDLFSIYIQNIWNIKQLNAIFAEISCLTWKRYWQKI